MILVIPFLLIGAAGAIAGFYGASKVTESEKILEDLKVEYESATEARSQVIANLENLATKYSQVQTKSANTVVQVISFIKEIGVESELKSLLLLVGLDYKSSKNFENVLDKSIIENRLSSNFLVAVNNWHSDLPPTVGNLSRGVYGFALYFQGEKALENIQKYKNDIKREIENINTSKSNLTHVSKRLSEIHVTLEGIYSRVLIGLHELEFTEFDRNSTEDVQKLQMLMILTKALVEIIRIPVVDENWNLNPHLDSIQAKYQKFKF